MANLIKCPDCGELVHFVTVDERVCCPVCGVIQEDQEKSTEA